LAKEVDTRELHALLTEGRVQAVEVLPAAEFEEEHLPGAVNLPLIELRADTVGDLDPDLPVVPYCYDYQCDLSSRAARRFETLGFEVLHYVAGKAAWLAMGLPAEGTIPHRSRAGALARPAATIGIDATIGDLEAVERPTERSDETDCLTVVTDDEIVVGLLSAEAGRLPDDTPVTAAMQPGPPTVRPSIRADELAQSMDRNRESRILVTTLDGRLVGLVHRDDLLGQP
jgi:rhodanese-related sulfurtransferase